MDGEPAVSFQVGKGFREQWELLIVCCYMVTVLWNWVNTNGKQKMIWNILAGEKWFNLQAASNNTSYLV